VFFTAFGIVHRRCCRLVTCHQPAACKKKHSSAPEGGRNYRPKHVELIEIINKLSLLHLVGCLYYSINDARSHKHHIYWMCVVRMIRQVPCSKGVVDNGSAD